MAASTYVTIPALTGTAAELRLLGRVQRLQQWKAKVEDAKNTIVAALAMTDDPNQRCL